MRKNYWQVQPASAASQLLSPIEWSLSEIEFVSSFCYHQEISLNSLKLESFMKVCNKMFVIIITPTLSTNIDLFTFSDVLLVVGGSPQDQVYPGDHRKQSLHSHLTT